MDEPLLTLTLTLAPTCKQHEWERAVAQVVEGELAGRAAREKKGIDGGGVQRDASGGERAHKLHQRGPVSTWLGE